VEAKKPIKVFTGIGQHGIPQQWEKYLVKYPSLKIIFLHMGCFDYGYTCIDVVKRNDNAYTEISNQYESQILRKCLREIPVSKILFGSSFPERLTSSSLIILDMLDIDEEYKRQIYNNNNRCFLGVGKDE
ncbi:MAG: amidohydrolase family protein, partial [Clostridiales bacterium]|nr:amidohydrolase family protein [Clostridiales bacterium]